MSQADLKRSYFLINLDTNYLPSSNESERLSFSLSHGRLSLVSPKLRPDERQSNVDVMHGAVDIKIQQTGPAVTFMLDRINKETGVAVSPQDHVRCLPCDLTRSGGYAPALGTVLLCNGHFWSKKQMEHTLTHELVHMYDHCKFDVEWNNLRHHACTEVCVAESFHSSYQYSRQTLVFEPEIYASLSVCHEEKYITWFTGDKTGCEFRFGCLAPFRLSSTRKISSCCAV